MRRAKLSREGVNCLFATASLVSIQSRSTTNDAMAKADPDGMAFRRRHLTVPLIATGTSENK
jgi:hypothetical protein